MRRLDDQLRRLAPAASLLDEALERRAVEMADAERRAAQVRDAVLAEFCAEIGVADARHFEETQLRYSFLFFVLLVSSFVSFNFTIERLELISAKRVERGKRNSEKLGNFKSDVVFLIEFVQKKWPPTFQDAAGTSQEAARVREPGEPHPQSTRVCKSARLSK